jgi:hypothetical protein
MDPEAVGICTVAKERTINRYIHWGKGLDSRPVEKILLFFFK